MPLLKREVRQQLRILDFDIENRPLAYLGSEFTTAEITAIAWSWIGEEEVEVAALSTWPTSGRDMLTRFRHAWNQADMVTGHYIRRHDLPIVNAALMEYQLPLLDEKLTQDTKMDLVRRKELSMSQEALAAMYGLPEAKHHMSNPEWREANRLTYQGIEWTKKRVVDDVIQHKALRARLLEAGALTAPKVWRP